MMISAESAVIQLVSSLKSVNKSFLMTKQQSEQQNNQNYVDDNRGCRKQNKQPMTHGLFILLSWAMRKYYLR